MYTYLKRGVQGDLSVPSGPDFYADGNKKRWTCRGLSRGVSDDVIVGNKRAVKWRLPVAVRWIELGRDAFQTRSCIPNQISSVKEINPLWVILVTFPQCTTRHCAIRASSVAEPASFSQLLHTLIF